MFIDYFPKNIWYLAIHSDGEDGDERLRRHTCNILTKSGLGATPIPQLDAFTNVSHIDIMFLN